MFFIVGVKYYHLLILNGWAINILEVKIKYFGHHIHLMNLFLLFSILYVLITVTQQQNMQPLHRHRERLTKMTRLKFHILLIRAFLHLDRSPYEICFYAGPCFYCCVPFCHWFLWFDFHRFFLREGRSLGLAIWFLLGKCRPTRPISICLTEFLFNSGV